MKRLYSEQNLYCRNVCLTSFFPQFPSLTRIFEIRTFKRRPSQGRVFPTTNSTAHLDLKQATLRLTFCSKRVGHKRTQRVNNDNKHEVTSGWSECPFSAVPGFCATSFCAASAHCHFRCLLLRSRSRSLCFHQLQSLTLSRLLFLSLSPLSRNRLLRCRSRCLRALWLVAAAFVRALVFAQFVPSAKVRACSLLLASLCLALCLSKIGETRAQTPPNAHRQAGSVRARVRVRVQASVCVQVLGVQAGNLVVRVCLLTGSCAQAAESASDCRRAKGLAPEAGAHHHTPTTVQMKLPTPTQTVEISRGNTRSRLAGDRRNPNEKGLARVVVVRDRRPLRPWACAAVRLAAVRCASSDANDLHTQ